MRPTESVHAEIVERQFAPLQRRIERGIVLARELHFTIRQQPHQLVAGNGRRIKLRQRRFLRPNRRKQKDNANGNQPSKQFLTVHLFPAPSFKISLFTHRSSPFSRHSNHLHFFALAVVTTGDCTMFTTTAPLQAISYLPPRFA